MEFVEGADINLYFYLITPDEGRPRLADQVRFATYGTNMAPSVGDVIEGDYGYRSKRGEVTEIKPIGRFAYAVSVKELEVQGSLPANVGVLIEIDQDHDPVNGHDFGDAEENAAYTKRFNDGELTAYEVSLVSLTDEGDVGCVWAGIGRFYPDRLASLCGCDVENGAADGLLKDLASIPDTYLRQVAEELIYDYDHPS